MNSRIDPEQKAGIQQAKRQYDNKVASSLKQLKVERQKISELLAGCAEDDTVSREALRTALVQLDKAMEQIKQIESVCNGMIM